MMSHSQANSTSAAFRVESIRPIPPEDIEFTVWDPNEERQQQFTLPSREYTENRLAHFLGQCEINSLLTALEELMPSETYKNPHHKGGPHPNAKWPRAAICCELRCAFREGYLDLSNIAPHHLENFPAFWEELLAIPLAQLQAINENYIPLQMLQDIWAHGQSIADIPPRFQRNLAYCTQLFLKKKLAQDKVLKARV